MKRREVRELALKVLYAHDIGKNDVNYIMERLFIEENTEEGGREFCRSLVAGVLANLKPIDDLIEKYTTDWPLDRMAAVDRNLMRIALFEFLFTEGVPGAVAVNEAIEVAKSYGSDESPRFINGILGNIMKDLPQIKAELTKGTE